MISDLENNIGGTEIYCLNLRQWLEECGHIVEIQSYGELRRTITFLLSFFNYRSIGTADKAIRTFNPDIIHIHGIFEMLSPSALIACRHHDIPVVATVTDYYHYICPKGTLDAGGKVCENGYGLRCVITGCVMRPDGPVKLIEWLRLGFHRLLLRRFVDHFISPSENLAEWTRVSLHVRRVTATPLAVDSISEEIVRNPTSRRRLIYVGRLTPEKGCSLLLRAMPEILKSCPQTQLTIVGQGDERKPLERLVENLGINESVTFLGFVSNQDIPRLYRESDLLILPSTCIENYPLAAIEALVNGLPVIASNHGGQREIIENGVNGYLFRSGSQEDLVKKVRAALTNPSLRETTIDGVELMRERHSKTRHVDEILGVYERVLRDKESREHA